MKMFLLTIVLLLIGVAGQNCTTSEDVRACILDYVDTDHNGNVTIAEIDFFFMYDICDASPPRVTGLGIIQRCDKNDDGVLNEVDFIHERSCANITGLVRVTCGICKKCNATRVDAKRAEIMQGLHHVEEMQAASK